ncbi:alpha-2,8-sialyltransferase 8E-like isoform X2 [Engraulis encrasicolus]
MKIVIHKLLSATLVLGVLGTFFTLLLWIVYSDNERSPRGPVQGQKSSAADPSDCISCSETIIKRAMERYSQNWRRQENNYKKFRALLSNKCHGASKAIVTQANTPVGSKVTFDGEKRKPLQVTQALFSVFPKESPFGNKTWETCSVVGNGGILTNSSCGQSIDSSQFVIRCNLPPVEGVYTRDVGNKTDLVTSNPSILHEKWAGLMERRRPFVEGVRPYGSAMILLPAFSYSHNTAVSLRATYTLEDFHSPARPVFLSPEYLTSLARFWRSQGMPAVRLSTGLIVTSLALELCSNVHLYGFWPFSTHPHGSHQTLTNHYYDNRESKKKIHAMPLEFEHLLRLHKQGVLRVHIGQCPLPPSHGFSSLPASTTPSPPVTVAGAPIRQHRELHR